MHKLAGYNQGGGNWNSNWGGYDNYQGGYGG